METIRFLEIQKATREESIKRYEEKVKLYEEVKCEALIKVYSELLEECKQEVRTINDLLKVYELSNSIK